LSRSWDEATPEPASDADTVAQTACAWFSHCPEASGPVTVRLGNADVLSRRAEELERGSADVCTARAFAPPDRAWEVAEPLLAPGGRLIYFAGGGAHQAPADAAILSTRPATLESAGPLVIMGR
jgi:hypothetical protein